MSDHVVNLRTFERPWFLGGDEELFQNLNMNQKQTKKTYFLFAFRILSMSKAQERIQRSLVFPRQQGSMKQFVPGFGTGQNRFLVVLEASGAYYDKGQEHVTVLGQVSPCFKKICNGQVKFQPIWTYIIMQITISKARQEQMQGVQAQPILDLHHNFSCGRVAKS